MNRWIIILVAVAAAVVALATAGGYALYRSWWHATYFEVETTRYDLPLEKDELPVANDVPGPQKPAFDAALVDSRPLGGWQLNASAAVIRLDCPMIKPDIEGAMLVLRPSYLDAIQAARQSGLALLPGANMLDGSAKQFDDGLYAALDLACFRGDLLPVPSPPNWVAAVWQLYASRKQCPPFLATALELAGRPVQSPSTNSGRWTNGSRTSTRTRRRVNRSASTIGRPN